MSVLGRKLIKQRLQHNDFEQRLFITPLLNPEVQIGDSSVDIRLGNDFKVTKRGNLEAINLGLPKNQIQNPVRRHCTNFFEAFTLHPNEFVLARTLEHFRLPEDVSGYVTSRSFYGRQGLIIATATIIHPGFNGTVILELVNVGQLPIMLYPGLCIAQMVFHHCEGATPYKGVYNEQTAANHQGTEDRAKKVVGKDDAMFWSKADDSQD